MKVKLPNYVKYVRNKKEFLYAIDNLLVIKKYEYIDNGLKELLYGYPDNRCGERISKIIKEVVNKDNIF